MEDTQGLSINLAAVAANYALLKSRAGGAVVGASIKANAYGLGMREVASALAGAGCVHFFVATIQEAANLRKYATGEIYVLNGIHAGPAHGLKNVVPVLNSLEDIAQWTGPCALHFDTGMNRLGIAEDEAAQIIRDPKMLEHLEIKLAMSHYTSSEDINAQSNKIQASKFAALKKRMAIETRWSLANSSGIFHMPDDLYDMVRPGYALYGGNPTPEKENPMQNVVTLSVPVLQVRSVKKGESIGYNGTHTFDADAETATINIGYADGFMRAFGHGQVYFDGQACPVLGRVSMDLVTIGIGHLGRRPKPGSLIEVLGPNQSIDQLAASGGTIGYEVLTSLGGRYQRHYISAS